MVDAVDDDEARRVIDLVDHAGRAAASRPQPFQLTVERPADAMGVLQERAESTSSTTPHQQRATGTGQSKSQQVAPPVPVVARAVARSTVSR